MKPCIPLGLGVLVVLFAGSCGPGSDCDSGGIQEHRSTLDALDRTAPRLGFSLEDVLILQEPLALELQWMEAPDNIPFSPSDASTTATVRLSYEDAPIDEVEVRCSEPENFSEPLCDDRLETTMVMSIETEDGALDESFEVTYKAYSRKDVRWSALSLDYKDFSGSFEMPPIEDVIVDDRPVDALYLGFFGHTAEGNSGGAFIGHTETTEDEHLSFGFVFHVAHLDGSF